MIVSKQLAKNYYNRLNWVIVRQSWRVFLNHSVDAGDIVKLLSRPGSPIIPVTFLTYAPISISNGNPFSGGVRHTGVGQFCDFRLKSSFISKTVRDRPAVATER